MPWPISLRILEELEADEAHLCLTKDGDHWLSRESDIEGLIRPVKMLTEFEPSRMTSDLDNS